MCAYFRMLVIALSVSFGSSFVRSSPRKLSANHPLICEESSVEEAVDFINSCLSCSQNLWLIFRYVHICD